MKWWIPEHKSKEMIYSLSTTLSFSYNCSLFILFSSPSPISFCSFFSRIRILLHFAFLSPLFFLRRSRFTSSYIPSSLHLSLLPLLFFSHIPILFILFIPLFVLLTSYSNSPPSYQWLSSLLLFFHFLCIFPSLVLTLLSSSSLLLIPFQCHDTHNWTYLT